MRRDQHSLTLLVLLLPRSSFFNRWYESLGKDAKASFKSLIARGQIEFVNGGWVQNDEANPDPVAMINQMATGHEYLLKNFGTAPRIAWQIGQDGRKHAVCVASCATTHSPTPLCSLLCVPAQIPSVTPLSLPLCGH